MSTTTFAFPMANGVQSVALADGMAGELEFIFNGTAPSAGTLKVEGLTWTGSYFTIGGGSAINLTALSSGPIRLGEFGHFQALRLTLSGVTGAVGNLTGAVNSVGLSAPSLAFAGYRGMIMQGYEEANTKNGTQFYVQIALPAFSGAGTYNLVMQTGALPVLVKNRAVYSDAGSLSVQLFKAPTGVTGGTAVAVQNYNDINPVATTTVVTKGATIATPGTAWGDPQHIYNSGASGQRVASNLGPNGDRVLAPNKLYLIQIINASGAANADFYASWYEGQPDLPRK